MDEFLKELEKMTLSQVEERITKWEKEVRDAKSTEEIDGKEDELEALMERRTILKNLEERKRAAIELQNGAVPEKAIESRKNGKSVDEKEMRAKAFTETGKIEMRTILSSGKIAKPSDAASEINDIADVAADIVDDVNAISLTGTGAWIVGYQKTNSEANDVVDGENVGGTGATYDYVTINPSEWGITDEVSKQVKKMTPANYLAAVEKNALIALRVKASDKIVAAIKASELVERKTAIALDADYLKTLVLGFRSVKTKGAVKLYIAQEDLLTLGKVRGTNDKKAIYDISFDEGSTVSGTIKEGGIAVKFRVLDQLSTGTQLFGQPKAIDMPMWDNYEISTDEGGEYFRKNQIGIKGIQTAGADLVVWHGMQVITQA